MISAALRVGLVLGGGQHFFWDEGRYDRGVDLYLALRAGDWPAARDTLGDPAHVAFTPATALLAAGQHLGTQAFHPADWRQPEARMAARPLATVVLGLFSVLNIALVYAIARRSTRDESGARWAALLMAGANTGFYFARHLLPYDLALCSALVAIVIGLGGHRSLRAGLFAGLSCHLYNGYWYLLPVLFVIHGWDPAAQPATRLRRLGRFGVGAMLALALPVLLGVALNGRTFWERLVGFSGSATQGDYNEGWSLPWAYLWHSETAFGLVVAAGLVAALAPWRRPQRPADRTPLLWLSAAGIGYGLLVLFSLGLHKFVVYGRTVKPLVPLLCLAAGWAASRLCHGRKRVSALAMVAIAGLAACNLLPHFLRVFPRDVETRLLRELGNPKRALSVRGSIYVRLSVPVTRPELVLVNCQFLFPIGQEVALPAGRTLLRLEHPLTYAPYQYEGHLATEREFLRTHDISMRLIRCDQPEAVPDEPGLPAPRAIPPGH